MKLSVGCVLAATLLHPGSVVAAHPDPQTVDWEQADSSGAPLFASHDLLTFTIEGPLGTIFEERGQESNEHPAVLVLDETGGATTRFDIKVRTRGKTRLNRHVCEFPPIRLNFQRNAVEGTVFAGEDKLKLVTHCQDRKPEYEQYVLKEYLAYRMFNLLSDLSLRVRLARITYVDTATNKDPLTKYGFLIEHDDMLAARVGREVLSIRNAIPPDAVEPGPLTVVEIFNYMIGNTDFSACVPPEDDECCHNVKLLGTVAGPVLPVPYDFDFAGLVDTPYAEPSPILRTRSVRQRVFRGFCRSREYVDRVVPLFQEKKDAIYALVREQEGLEEREVERSLDYLDEFYEILDDPRKITREFVERCRTS